MFKLSGNIKAYGKNSQYKYISIIDFIGQHRPTSNVR